MTESMDSLLKRGALDEARALAGETLEESPGERNALLTLARLAVFEGDLGKAGELVARATLDGIDDTNSLLVKAALASERDDDTETAQRLYEQAIRDGKPPRSEPYFGLGFLLASQGHFTAAQKPLKKAVELDPTVGQYHFHLARVLLADENIPDGLPHLEQAITLNPLYVPAYEACCVVLQEFNETEAAEKLLREGLKLMPGQPALQALLSNVLVSLGKVPEAVELSKQLAIDYPTEPGALGNLARMMMATGKRDEALELVRALRERGQATPQTMALEGMILETNEPPDLEGAIVAYASAAKADGGDWGSLNNLAHILMRLPTGEPKENLAAAAEALEGAKKRAPHRLEPVLNLALVYARLEQQDDALAAAKEVIERAGKAQAELKQQAEKLVATLQKKK